jgi:four helix bundle protein
MKNAKEEPALKTAVDIQQRTFAFAVRIVKLCRHLEEKPGVGRTLSRQLLRAGTSVGANIEEAQSGTTKADFIYKVAIALKEARETDYWLRLLQAAQVVPVERLKELKGEAEQLKRILAAIIVSAKNGRK